MLLLLTYGDPIQKGGHIKFMGFNGMIWSCIPMIFGIFYLIVSPTTTIFFVGIKILSSCDVTFRLDSLYLVFLWEFYLLCCKFCWEDWIFICKDQQISSYRKVGERCVAILPFWERESCVILPFIVA